MNSFGLLGRADRALDASQDAYAMVTMLFFPRKVAWAAGLSDDTLRRLVPLFDRSFERLSQLRDDQLRFDEATEDMNAAYRKMGVDVFDESFVEAQFRAARDLLFEARLTYRMG